MKRTFHAACALTLLIFGLLFMPSCKKAKTTSPTGPTGSSTDTLGQTIQLWGMTFNGGASDSGMIFKINGDGSGFEKVYSFTASVGIWPWGSLTKAPNGKLYGITTAGGVYNFGTLFSFDPNTHAFKKIVDFDELATGIPNGLLGELVLANNGKLYGVTSTHIYCVDPSNDEFKTVYYMDDPMETGVPVVIIVGNDNKLYGTTVAYTTTVAGKSVIFSFDVGNNEFTSLYVLPRAGIPPYSCTLYAASDGNFYSLRFGNGTSDKGSFFKFNPATKAYSEILTFNGANGGNPLLHCNVREANNKLFGITMSGGPTDEGILFSYTLSSGIYKVERAFDSDSETFVLPKGLLVTKRNLIYLSGGGVNLQSAAILRYNPADSSYKTIYSFPANPADNISLNGDLIEL